MSSTEAPSEKKDRSAAEFFHEVLVPAALRERELGCEFFALRPDATAESYFVEPTRSAMRPKEFDLCACDSVEEFVRALATLWSSEGREHLAAMAPRLAALASELREDEEQPDDVSPFMYVMF